MTSKTSKFGLLMWKNWLIQKRHKVQTVFEILLPLLFALIFLSFREALQETKDHQALHFKPLNVYSLKGLSDSYYDFNRSWTIVYSPENPILDNIIRTSLKFLVTKEEIDIIAVENASALADYLAQTPSLVGVEFDDSWESLSNLPTNFSFALRFPSKFDGWHTDRMFPEQKGLGPRDDHSNDDGNDPGYYRQGFVPIQSAISRAYIEAFNPKAEQIPNLYMQRYAYPPYKVSPFGEALGYVVPVIMLLTFMYTAMNAVKYITIEKEQQLKEAMKIMGLPNWLHWAAWFVKFLIMFLVIITLLTIVMKLPNSEGYSVFKNSNWFLLWIYLFVYSMSTITFCFMVSTFFSKAKTAAMLSGAIWFLSYVPYSLAQTKLDSISFGIKIIICLYSNSAMALGFQRIIFLEFFDDGLHWNNLFKAHSNDLSVGGIILMLIFDTVLYHLMTLYIEKIRPGELGVPEKWYFPFTRSYWIGTKVNERIDEASVTFCTDSANIEPDPNGYRVGIDIKNLRKVYGNKKVAVNGLSMKMYQNQVTVLLGHNGAGKTTTMSMLTGMFPPTSGTALIDGKDIRSNIDGVRESLGLCPQHNILFDELTVREHIIFFSKLKGYSEQQVEAEVAKYVDLLELRPKIDALAKTLSGGQKRKLSVAVALCGGSKTVLVDEPTSGMDPSARRSLWDLLIKEKEGRTLLLTTHFMDEADVLGDRIAIMAEGELKCLETSFFLKKRYGVGYRLICVKDQSCDPQKTTEFLRQYIPDIQVETDIGTELSYILNDDYSTKFKEILENFEANAEELGISTYGVSLTTLEEVFLKVGSDSGVYDATNEHSKVSENGSTADLEIGTPSAHLLTGFRLYLNQAKAMLLKRIHATRRNWILTIIVQFLVPLFFLFVSVNMIRVAINTSKPPPLKMTLDTHETSTTVLQSDSVSTLNPLKKEIFKNYLNLFKNTPQSQNLETISDDMDTYILNLANSSLKVVERQYLIGASVSSDEEYGLIAWFNLEAYHTLPLSINLYYNALLKSYCQTCEINVENKPLSSKDIVKELSQFFGYILALSTGLAFAYVVAFFAFFYVKERVSRSKLMQLVSGANIYIFWGISFLWDYLILLISFSIFLIALASFQVEDWTSATQIGCLALLFITFAFSILPLTYIFTLMFTVPSTAFNRMTMFYMLLGSVIFIFWAIFDLIYTNNGEQKPILWNIFEWFFYISPLFSLTKGIFDLSNFIVAQKPCTEPFCQLLPECKKKCDEMNIFSWGFGLESPGIGKDLTFLLLMGIVYFIVLFCKEHGLFDDIIHFRDTMRKRESTLVDAQADSDVLNERQKVLSLTATDIKDYSVTARELTKYYKANLAVNKLSFAVHPSECFGLLGVNGAGKTSTFKMLTGDENISSGEAWVQGISLRTDKQQVNRIIGYCPQFDALLEDLTGRETLAIYCLLRGVPNDQVAAVSARLAADLNFTKHLDKKIKEYSGGNKRKLSTAVALIGNPVVVYLDEPTTGMDPGAKRQLWNMVCKVREQGRSIILTSHSMEECEALCTRLAIMVNGEFKCLGSTQHLKNKFSKGFVLTIKLSKTAEGEEPNALPIKEFVRDRFKDAVLKEEHSDMLHYHIPQTDLKWSEMFGIMEDAKQSLNIEDYSLGQTSLEQVFLFFSKYQRHLSADS